MRFSGLAENGRSPSSNFAATVQETSMIYFISNKNDLYKEIADLLVLARPKTSRTHRKFLVLSSTVKPNSVS